MVAARLPRLASLLPLLIAAACATAQPPSQPDRGVEPRTAATTGTADAAVRVMSFNIRYGTAGDGDNAWTLRRDMVFDVVRDYAPTVLGVQEALRFQLDQIRAALPHLGEVGVGRNDGVSAGEYAAILYDTRRLQPLESGTFWLSDTPDVPGSMHWGNRITRIVTWARFRDVALDTTWYVFNTHWDHESQPSRERSALLLLERIGARAAADPVIVTGDFNAGEDNPAVLALVGERPPGHATPPLRDTFRALHPDADDVGTFNAFRGERTGERIDAILVSPEWRIVAAAIDRRNVAGRYPSDHFPVTAVLRLR